MTEIEIRNVEQANLDRRLRVIPDGVHAWNAAAGAGDGFGIHVSQLAAVKILMDELSVDQTDQLKKVRAAAAGQPYADAYYLLLQKLSGAQDLWRIFHTILTQRQDPQCRPLVDMADLVANDCYAAIMARAKHWGVRADDEVRAPPLTYLESSISPSTASRGEGLQTIGFPVRQYRDRMLPIPIVLFPYDQASSMWMLCSLAHEVGHNLDHDLEPIMGRRLTDSLRPLLINRVADTREPQWRRWLGEMFADVIAILLAGEGFARSMVYLSVPLGRASAFQQLDPLGAHPPFHLRLRLLAEFLNKANSPELTAAGAKILDVWNQVDKPAWQSDFVADVPAVADLLLLEKLPSLKNHATLELQDNLGFNARFCRNLAAYWNDPTKARPNYLQNPFPLRLIPAAAAIALDGVVHPDANSLDALHETAVTYFKDAPTPNMLGVEEKYRQYFRKLSQEIKFEAGKD